MHPSGDIRITGSMKHYDITKEGPQQNDQDSSFCCGPFFVFKIIQTAVPGPGRYLYETDTSQ